MKNWKVPKEVNKYTWSVIAYDDFNVVVPTVDIDSHDIDSTKCHCGARTTFEDGSMMIVHNSWRDKDRVQVALENIFGDETHQL